MNIEAISKNTQITHDRLRNNFLGRQASVVGPPDLAGTDGIVEDITFNPHGVVIVTLKTLGANARRLRLPADTLTFGLRVEPVPRRHYQRQRPRLVSPPAVALRHGRVVL